jgi:multidrug efflux pump subunit AcrB
MSAINLSEIAVRYRSITLFLILATIGAGTLAFFQMGRAEDPSFTIKVFTVSAAWPGASAEEMQNQVADPLEKRLQELRYYDRSETTVRAGIMLMTVSLVDTTPPDAVEDQFYQARKKLADEAPLLPRGVQGPFVNDEYSDVFFALYQLQADGLPHHELVDEAERLRGLYLQVPGVEKVSIIGEQPQRFFIEISNERLATLGIGVDAIASAIGEQNLVVPSGSLQTPTNVIRLKTDSDFDDLEAVRNTPVAVGGRSIRLGDIATVRRGYEDPSTFLVRHAGEPAITLGLVMRRGFNGLELGNNLVEQTRQIQAELPVGMSLTQIADQAYNIDKAYSEFMVKFVMALGVVMVVSFVSLGFRVGLVVAAAVPLTLAAVFVIMLATDRNFDRITLGALILSLGLLVDDAIIAIEMMVVKMEEGFDRVAAATYAWGATAAPMLTGTLVTVLGFLAIGFAPSSAGEYAGNIFWIVAFALLVSWLVAVYFTPYLGVKMLPEIKPVEGGHDAIYASKNYQKLRTGITRAVDRRSFVVILVAGLFALCAALMASVVPQQFFPSSDRGEAIVEVYLPKGSSIAATTQVVSEIETELTKLEEAQTIDSFVGAGAPRFFLSLDPELPDPSFAKILVVTQSDVDREAVLDHVDTLVAQGRFPGARVRTTRLLYGPPVKYPVSFRISGPDIGMLREISERVAAEMRATEGTIDVNTDWGNRSLAIQLEFDENRLRQIGLTPTSAAQQISGFIDGSIVSEARIGIRNVGVVLRSPEGPGFDPARIGDISVRTSSGQAVPLRSIAKLTPIFEEPILVRRNRVPTITVRSDVSDNLQPPQVTAAVEPRIDEIRSSLPAGYNIETGGSVEESAKAEAALLPLFPIMLILMLTIIIVQTRSFRLTALVIATAPLGLIGAVPALLISGKPFGFTAILGLLGLAGIIMRNTLILTDQIDQEKENGLGVKAAVIEATVRRARPVILTALAAVLAFIPLTFSSFWGAMAVTLIGGTFMGTVLTILFLPALYGLIFKVENSDQRPHDQEQGASKQEPAL